jgi:hypothetical protein
MNEYVTQFMEQIKDIIPEEKAGDLEKLLSNTLTEANKGLEANRNEILGKLNKLKKSSTLDKLEKSEYNELLEAKKQLDELLEHKAKEEGDYNALIERLENKHQSALQAMQSQIDELKTVNTQQSEHLNKTLIDNGLTDALTKANIKPELLEAGRALLRQKAALNQTDDGQFSALIEDKPMNEYITEWASNQGKAFLLAPDNSGSGSVEGGKASEKMSLADIAQIADRGERIKAMEEAGY